MFQALNADAPGLLSAALQNSTKVVPVFPVACSQMLSAVSSVSRYLRVVQAILEQEAASATERAKNKVWEVSLREGKEGPKIASILTGLDEALSSTIACVRIAIELEQTQPSTASPRHASSSSSSGGLLSKISRFFWKKDASTRQLVISSEENEENEENTTAPLLLLPASSRLEALQGDLHRLQGEVRKRLEGLAKVLEKKEGSTQQRAFEETFPELFQADQVAGMALFVEQIKPAVERIAFGLE